MWNSMVIECPETDLVEYLPQDNHIAENLREFITVLSTAADTLTSENPLWSEMKVLGNIQAKYKRLLRCDKCLIYLQRIGHCIRKMVLLNLSKSYLDLAERFLLGFQDLSDTFRLPSCQQVEYILIRTLTSSKLVIEALRYSREAFCYLIRKLKVGHLILDLIMASSVTARINILLRGTLEHLCSIYKQVLFWRHKIKRGSFEWKEKVDFPLNLEEWIKSFEPGYLKPLPMSQVCIDNLKLLLNQNGEKSEVESDAESITIIEDDSKTGAPAAAKRMNDNDYGEVIPRKKAKISHNQINVEKSLLQKIVGLHSLKDLENLWYDIRDYPQDSFPKVLTSKKRESVNKFISSIKQRVTKKRFYKTFKTEPPVLKAAKSLFCKYLGYNEDDIEMCKKSTGETEMLKEIIDISDKIEICKESTNASNETEICEKIIDVSDETEVCLKSTDVSDEIEMCTSTDVSDEIEMCTESTDVSNAIEMSKKIADVSYETKKMPKPFLPVKNLKNLKILYKQLRERLKADKEMKKFRILKRIFMRRRDGIKLLKQNGQKLNAKKLILYTSKELLALYES